MFCHSKLIILLFSTLFFIPLATSGLQEKPDRKETADSSLIRIDDLLVKVENVHTALDSINKISRSGFDTREIERELPRIVENLNLINENLTHYGQTLNVKNLQMFQVLLDDITLDLNRWRYSLFRYNRELASMQNLMTSFRQDSTLRKMVRDSTFLHIYLNELKGVKEKWKQAKKFTSGNLLKVAQLQAQVSKAYFQSIELEEIVLGKLREFRGRSMGPEYPPLYTLRKAERDNETLDLLKRSYIGQRKILIYYVWRKWNHQLMLLIVCISFFAWVSHNFNKADRLNAQPVIAQDKFKYIRPIPILATLVVILNLAPFFDLNPPSAYVEMTQFFLLIVLTVLFARNWPRQIFYYWLMIIILYVLFTIANGIITPGIKTRFSLLILNGISVVFGLLFIWRIRKALSMPDIVRVVSYIYVVLNILAALSNTYGRVSLAKVFSMAAIFGLTQIIALSVFIQIITESFYLQMNTAKLSRGIASRLNYENIFKGLNKALSIIIIILWIIIFSTNLGIYSPIYDAVAGFLIKERTLGNITFTFANLMLFIGILYLSHILQKYVGYFFGESEDHFIPDKKGSRLVVLRLILIILGFMLAITASGLPIDKITIVLGALGVGIGLGLQNIVNNLVSGIILIFERPFEIGDSIEVGNKKGRVKDIGIRSSRLVSSEGSEIIVPNGDLLSGQVINWSQNDELVRSEFTFKVSPDHLTQAREVITDILSRHESVVKRIPSEILLTAIADAFVEMKVQFWLTNIRKEQAMKSEILMEIYQRLREKNIRIL